MRAALALAATAAVGALLAALPAVRAGTTELWWNITYVEGVNPDGLFPRRAIGVNGSWPPPPIDVSTNDTLVLHAFNSLSEPTTLHHHGMYFNGVSWMDGAIAVSQCGIPPGETFTYTVPVNASGQHGSYWIHAHAMGHYVDGLRAPLTLHPPTEEYTVVLGDWYHQEHSVLIKQFISIANPGGAEPVPDAALIYFAQNGTYLNGYGGNATLPFEPGKTYRLRVVNTAAFSMFYFWIDGHAMRIIEVDGTDTQEAPVDLLALTVAQRYSVLVTARNDSTPASWAVHANMDTTMFDTVPDTLNPNATASISYATGAPLEPPATIDAYSETNDTALVPIPAVAQYAPAARTVPLLVAFNTMTDGTNRATFNNITYDAPIVPTVFSALSLDADVGPGSAEVASAYGPWNFILSVNETVDIVVMNSDTGNHPFHLHGHKFQIVGRGTDYTSSDPALNPPVVEGQANPVRRDTVQVDAGGRATLRFVADNPGAWFFHCHIEWHLESGLAVTFVTSPTAMLAAAADDPVPGFLYDQCAALGVPTAGNAAGLNSTTDLTGLPLGPFLQNNGWHARGIGAMAGCVLTAVLGMASVSWYALGERLSDAEVEEDTRRKADAKAARGRFYGVGRVARLVRKS
ncbi:Fet3 protein [Phellopilus nigrolimitatus]|nr:Fet3 protein [Phellopilus nigrolimitatus]